MAQINEQIPGESSSVNELFLDAMLQHALALLSLSSRVTKRILKILDATENDIKRQIVDRLNRSRSPRRLQQLLTAVQTIRNGAWDKAAPIWREELLALAKQEPAFVSDAINRVSPVVVSDFTFPDPRLLTAVVTEQPFQGDVMRNWARNIRRADLRRLLQQIRIGVTQGEPSDVIARRVVGSVRQRGRNGITEVTRREATAITRTAVTHVTNAARREMFLANADVFEFEVYVATLDSRTTPQCRALDGKRFPVGKGPIPPIHWNCRSVRVAQISQDGLIGERPFKAVTEEQLLRDYTAQNGLNAVSSRAQLPRGHKGRFDAFARKEARRFTGQLDAKVNYQEFLSRQPVQFQKDVLGATRAKLFRQGGLTVQQFVNDKTFMELPLRDLAQRYPNEFRAAGLDPARFN